MPLEVWKEQRCDFPFTSSRPTMTLLIFLVSGTLESGLGENQRPWFRRGYAKAPLEETEPKCRSSCSTWTGCTKYSTKMQVSVQRVLKTSKLTHSFVPLNSKEQLPVNNYRAAFMHPFASSSPSVCLICLFRQFYRCFIRQIERAGCHVLRTRVIWKLRSLHGVFCRPGREVSPNRDHGVATAMDRV